jgi:hypothetical protein
MGMSNAKNGKYVYKKKTQRAKAAVIEEWALSLVIYNIRQRTVFPGVEAYYLQ